MPRNVTEGLKIVLLCVAASVMYGILHDQVTARVCIEYFTIGHPPILDTASPTLLALGWGVLATWWVGLLLGVPAALASRIGSWPKYDAARLIHPVLALLLFMAAVSLFAGALGFLLAKAGGIWLVEPLRSKVPAAKHAAYLADLWAHLASYAAGLAGGLIICGWTLVKRRRKYLEASLSPSSRSSPASVGEGARVVSGGG